MAGKWLKSDIDGLGRLAIVIDGFYCTKNYMLLAEIRLQEARFGLSPLDRSRLQWEIAKGDEATERRDKQRAKREAAQEAGTEPRDPRSVLQVVPKVG